MKNVILLLLLQLSAITSCSDNPETDLKNVYDTPKNTRYKICNYEDYDVSIAVGEETGSWASSGNDLFFSRGWKRIPSHTCVDVTNFYYLGRNHNTSVFPAFRGFYSISEYGYYEPSNGYGQNYYNALCIPIPLDTNQTDWHLSWEVEPGMDEGTAKCPSGSLLDYMQSIPWDADHEGDTIVYSFNLNENIGTSPSKIEDYGYPSDSPVPTETRKLVREKIIPKAPVKGVELENALKTWRGLVLTEQQRTLILMIHAIGAAFDALVESTSSFAKKVSAWLDSAVDAVKSGAKCVMKTGAAGDGGDLYEILGGYDLCTGERLTFQGRSISAIALIGGTAKFWRAVGDITGVPMIVKKVSKASENFLPKMTFPENNGKWKGERGNGIWYSDKAVVTKITKGVGVPFHNGFPDFSKWSKGQKKFNNLTGLKSDFDLVHEWIMDWKNLKNKTQAQLWLRKNKLTAHHLEDGKTIQLIPTDLHTKVVHTGGAALLRAVKKMENN